MKCCQRKQVSNQFEILDLLYYVAKNEVVVGAWLTGASDSFHDYWRHDGCTVGVGFFDVSWAPVAVVSVVSEFKVVCVVKNFRTEIATIDY